MNIRAIKHQGACKEIKAHLLENLTNLSQNIDSIYVNTQNDQRFKEAERSLDNIHTLFSALKDIVNET